MSPAPALPPVIDVERFRTLRAQPGVRVAEVRWALDGSKDRSTFLAGHVPGSVYIDLGTALAAPARPEAGRHPLPDPADFAAALGAAGIGDGDTVLALDDTDGSQASRLVWMLRALGVEAALLDGGLAAWTADGGELSTDALAPGPAAFTPRPWGSDVTASADEVEAVAGRPGSVVIDARAPERFRGDTEPIDPRAGHVPGAINVPFAGNVGADGRFLDPQALRERFAAAGVGETDEIIVYCGSGVTATHDLLALERAGFTGARLFPGSWSQWSADARREVATGE
ncbi:sulfurtransferase [Brachybacterium halotolerans subsp. kimchii]|uniref:sulfurtransferase n=1 Tax=Brachybacterium halotolerans TaxID=2795215 RepID=UPI001E5F7974|nr:sulfurtransferase [Brachybacterium halotolerans]UEJ81992.1 sulfurtransferase [Brachybacterium halotolerans subsp. kimchii]